MTKRQKSLEREALRVAVDLATAGSKTAATWLAEVESGQRPASLASLIAAEWQGVTPTLARVIATMDDGEAEAVLRGPIRRMIQERAERKPTDGQV